MTLNKEEFESFKEFEENLNTYKQLSGNPQGLNYIEKQELESSKKFVRENYEVLINVYLYQIKAKVAMAYNLPQEKIGNFDVTQSSGYSSIDNTIDGRSIPKISNEPKAYLSRLLNNDSTVLIPKELKNAANDLTNLESMSAKNDNFSYSDVIDTYNNFLKFLSLEFESDEKGNISLSDKQYTYSDDDLIEYYYPTYENLKEKMKEQNGKLKSSQKKRLDDIMNKIVNSLRNVIYHKIDLLEMSNSDYTESFRRKFIEILEGYTDSNIETLTKTIDSLYELNNNLNSLSQSNNKTHEQNRSTDDEITL